MKKLSESKTRLSDTLSLDDRQLLVLVMLEDVVTSLQKSKLVDELMVLTPDKKVVDYAEELGAQAIMDATHNGINESIAKATDYRIKEGNGSPLLIIPVDVPLVKSSTIDTIVCKAENFVDALVVISPSKSKGTNALLRNPPDAIPTHYGVNSFDSHVAEAKTRRIHLEIYRSEDLEIDVDTSSDLYEVMRRGDSTKTSGFLRGILQKKGRLETKDSLAM